MKQKTISLTENAYNELVKLKKPEESFSQLILRITTSHERPSLDKLFGIGQADPEWIEITNTVEELRKQNPHPRVTFENSSPK